MNESDKKSFAEIINTAFRVLGCEVPERESLRAWWGLMKQFSIAQVGDAFTEYVRRGKFQPKPSDIIEIIERLSPDGRPTADEAWSLVPRDEATTAVLSDEIAEAMAVSRPLLDTGDQVAARMAFRDTYNRLVEENRRAGKRVRWFPSLGHYPDGRAPVIAAAVAAGRLSMGRATALLPHKKEEMENILGHGSGDKKLSDDSARGQVFRLASGALKRINGDDEKNVDKSAT